MPERRTKIATCCYCGTRAALVLAQSPRHELSCSACGAPLHNMKPLPRAWLDDRPAPARPARPRAAAPGPARASHDAGRKPVPRKNRPRKRALVRKGRDFWDDITDLVEDLFDEIFD